MSNAQGSLTPSYFFGLKSDFTGNVWFVEDNVICYVSGNVCVLYNLDTRTQRWIHPSETCEAVTSLALPTTRRVVALCERSRRGAQVTLVELPSLKKRKPLQVPEGGPTEFILSSFSSDSRLLAVQEGAPAFQLFVFNWEKGKVVGSTQATLDHGKSINSIRFHPTDPSILVVGGLGVLSFYRVTDGMIKLLPLNTYKKELGNILCHSFVTEKRCIVCTDNGELILFENTGSCIELKSYIPTAPTDATPLYSILPTTKGFIVGSTECTLRLYEESDDAAEYYRVVRHVRAKQNSERVISLSASPSDDLVLCSTNDCQAFQLSLGNMEMAKPEDIRLEMVLGPFHGPNSVDSTRINDISICLRKPILVTCGADRTIKVWNYQQRTVELSVRFDEDIHAISVHPSGMFAVVGFASKVKLMNILSNDIQSYYEFPIKGCCTARFSQGGHRAAISSQSNTVLILNTYQCQIQAELTGHQGRVEAIEWACRDQLLFTACRGGVVIKWEARTGRRLSEYREKPFVWHNLSSRMDGTVLYIEGQRSEQDMSSVIVTMDFPFDSKQATIHQETDLPGVTIGGMAFSSFNQTLYASQATQGKPGCLLSMKMPGGDIAAPIPCHSGKGVRLALSYDEKTLISVGEDASIGVFQVRSSSRSLREQRLPFSEEILVLEKEIEEHEDQTKLLEDKVSELTFRNDHQLRNKEVGYEETITDLKEDFEETIKGEVQRIAELHNDTDRMEGSCVKKILQLKQDFSSESADLEASQKAKIDAEVKRFGQLCEERDHLNEANDKENQILMSSHARHRAEVFERYTEMIQEESEECKRLMQLKETIQQERKSREKELEDDCDSEINTMNRSTQQRIQSEQKQQEALMRDTMILMGTQNSLKETKAECERQKDTLKKTEVKRYATIHGLEKDITGHKKEIKEREDTIADKDKRIYELNRKNQELEKFKFVLDYKIKELKRQIKPRQEQITRLKQQIQEMDQELEQYHRSNASLDLMIGELRMKSVGMRSDLNSQKQLCQNARGDLQVTYQFIAEYKKLKQSVTHLFAKYVREYDKQGSQNDAAIQEEYNRRREYLERNVNSIKLKIEKEMQCAHAAKLRLMRENSLLTQEINDLRREIRFIKQSEKAGRLESMRDSTLGRHASALSATNESTSDLENPQKVIDMQQTLIFELIQRFRELGGVLDRPPPQVVANNPIIPRPPSIPNAQRNALRGLKTGTQVSSTDIRP